MNPKITHFLKEFHTLVMRILYRTGFFGLMIILDTRPRILLYHGVTSKEATLVGIRNHRKKHVKVDAFEAHIRYLSEHFRIVSLATLLSEVEKGNGKGLIALTFDDGYENVYKNAFPILKKYNAPMTFYIVGNFVLDNEPLWVDRIEYALDATTLTSVTIVLEKEWTFPLNTREERMNADNTIRMYAKRVPNDERLRVITDVERLCTVSLKNSLSSMQDYRPASVAQLREMQESGLVELGGHTLTHPILSNLTEAVLETEIRGSTTFIKDNFSRIPVTFAYPNGGFEDYSDTVIEYLKKDGYTNAPITDESFVTLGVHPFKLPRITIDNANAMYHFLFRLTGLRFIILNIKATLIGRKK